MIGCVVPTPVTRQPANPLAGGRRLARAAGLGLATYGLAVGAHAAAGGHLPGWPVSVALTALLGVLAVAVTRRRLRLPALLAALVGSQGALHVLLSLLETPSASCAMGAGGHHADTVVCGPAAAASATMLMPSMPMLVAHAGATVATAWVLARGEAWLWRVLRSVVRLPVPARRSPGPRPAVPGPAGLRSAARWLRPDAPRGPPPAAAHVAT